MKKITVILLALAMLISALSFGTIAEDNADFVDVPAESWYYEGCMYCRDNALMKGVGNSAFSPLGKVTREQFVQALANFNGADLISYQESSADTPFEDVKEGEWYSNAIEWARVNGIVTGISDTAFGLGKEVSREQMATMLVRYAEYMGQKTNYPFDLNGFADNASISDWANSGVEYSAAFGLFKGDNNSQFNPKGTATRAELATVLMRAHKISKSRIVCFGDSLTMGIETGFSDIVETPYPERVGEYLGVDSVNYGIGSELSDMIATRQGGIPLYVNNLTIPEDTTPVRILPVIDGNSEVYPFGFYGFEGINDVEIAGVKGKITDKDGGKGTRFNTAIYFMRNEPGKEVKVTERTLIVTHPMSDKRDDDILVIWSGSNDLKGASNLEKIPEIIANQQAMVDYAGTDEFIIVGFTANSYIGIDGFRECTDLANEILKEYWGEHYLDIKEYMATEQVLIDHGIEPTPLDLEFLAKGWIPESLLEKVKSNGERNYIHFNQLGYDIMADMVAEKIVALGYLG
ncbi:MAG: S-layer homology domain-containing protein [Clostridia bacterium]|nr:S-layer homology domain-containing protein [Clostridia bacterium]